MGSDDRLVKVLASALGLGRLPVAPGTWASAAAAGVYLGVRVWAGPCWSAILWAALAVVAAVGLIVCARAEAAYGKKDPGQFVLDEVAGQWLTCLLFWWRSPLATAIAAFAAFRLFDIAKPPPVRQLEKLPGGWGVMSDDLAAGLYAAGLLWLLRYGLLDRLLQG